MEQNQNFLIIEEEDQTDEIDNDKYCTWYRITMNSSQIILEKSNNSAVCVNDLIKGIISTLEYSVTFQTSQYYEDPVKKKTRVREYWRVEKLVFAKPKRFLGLW